MSSSNESLVRSIASQIAVTFVFQVFGKDLKVLLTISALASEVFLGGRVELKDKKMK
jgi:hypothetical protein